MGISSAYSAVIGAMNERMILVGWFALGVGLEVFLLIGRDLNGLKMLGAVAAGLFVTFLTVDNDPAGPPFYLLWGIIGFAVTFSLLFKDDVLPRINEEIVLSYTLIFWYVFQRNYAADPRAQLIGAGLMFAPLVALVCLAVSDAALTAVWKLALYAWFLISVVGIGVLAFPPERIAMFIPSRELPWMTRSDATLAGMGFLYLAASATYLFYLLPLPAKDQLWEERMKAWHAFVALLLQRTDGDPLRRNAMLAVLLGEGGILAVNYRTLWIPDGLLVNTFIILPCLVAYFRRVPEPSEEVATESEAPSGDRPDRAWRRRVKFGRTQ
jgi:hypothetical protein